MGDDRVDVLIVTALQDELEAVLEIGDGGKSGWSEERDAGGFRYHCRELPTESGSPIRVAAAWSGEMGESAAAARAAQLVQELAPACLAMCGICAGRRGKVSLGDVIVADRVYSYDHGELIANAGRHQAEPTLFRDIETYNLRKTWKMDAAFFARELGWSADLVKERPRSRAAQERWLLHALFDHEQEQGPEPSRHPDRKARCPDWSEKLISRLREQGLLKTRSGVLALTNKGQGRVREDRIHHPDGLPDDPPFAVHVGPIATGKTVQRDPELFDRLEHHERRTLGVEMEAAAIGHVAELLGRRSIIAKAAADHGDHEKDDGFRRFACRASARFLIAFLERHFDPDESAWSDPALSSSRGAGSQGSPRGSSRRDEDDVRNGLRDDLLARVERVYRLREPDAQIVRHRAGPGTPFHGWLEVSAGKGARSQVFPVAALDQPMTDEALATFTGGIDAHYRRENPLLRSTLVHAGPAAPDALVLEAKKRGVDVVSFAEYQGLIDFTRYLAWQTKRLENDPVYPPALYVAQRALVSVGGQEMPPVEDVLAELRTLLDSPHPRFALILGDFGAGKTFLLHELARTMASGAASVAPILVEMRSLEKQRSLKALLAQHFALADVGRIDLDAFLYMLAEGQVALLFDGFDELALRVTYDRAVEHFDTLMEAAGGKAKVIVTSRTQHFLTDHDAKRELARRAEAIPGYRLLKVQPFGEEQIRRFLVNRLRDEAAADERLRLLDEVKDLLGLSANPRMLGFIAEVEAEKLKEARRGGGTITSAALYGLLIDRWLEGEHRRVNPSGAPVGLGLDQLRAAATELAVLLWPRTQRAVRLRDLPAGLTEAVQALGPHRIEPGVIEHQLGSGSLLVRDEEGSFSFVHQSVLEWLVARSAAAQCNRDEDPALLGACEMSDLMADFFAALAGRAAAEAWARKRLAGSADEIAKKNALCVLRRIDETDAQKERDLPFVYGEVDFAGHNLRGQNLAGTDLRRANLRGTNLIGATLARADLTGARLENAQLVRADLTGANLANADMSGADLSFARLLGADLQGARLDNANLRAAKLVGAKVAAASGAWVEGVRAVGAAPPAPDGIEVMVSPISLSCRVLAWSPRGDLLAVGYGNGSVQLWDVPAGRPLRTLRGDGAALRLVFSADGAALISGSASGVFRVWSVATGRRLTSLKEAQRAIHESREGRVAPRLQSLVGSADCMALSPDGAILASGAHDHTIRLWDVDTGAVLHALEGHGHRVRSLTWSPDGAILASRSEGGTVRLWEVSSGRALRALDVDVLWPESVAWSPDGATLACGSHQDIQLWDVASGKLTRALKRPHDPVTTVAFDPSGAALALATSNGIGRAWDYASGSASRIPAEHRTNLVKSGLMSVAFSPVAAAAGFQDRTVMVWPLSSDSTPRILGHHSAPVTRVAWSSGGAMLASSSSGSISLWNVESGRVVGVIKTGRRRVNDIAWSPDGAALASTFGSSIQLWDVPSGQPRRAFKRHGRLVLSVAWSSGGAVIASGSDDATVRLWDAASGDLLGTLRGHEDHVNAVAFGPDGAVLASGSGDGTIRLWDTSSQRIIRVLEHPEGWVSSVAWSSGGAMLASGSHGGTVRLWDVASGACLATLLHVPEGWVAFTPDGRFRMGGDIAGAFWHVVGLCRFEPGELDPYLDRPLRIPEGEPLLSLRGVENH